MKTRLSQHLVNSIGAELHREATTEGCGSKHESGTSRVEGLNQDLSGSGCDSGTSEGIVLSQNLCGYRQT